MPRFFTEHGDENEIVMNTAEQEALRADLLRTISHDLRTPLTSISGNAALLLDRGEQLDSLMGSKMTGARHRIELLAGSLAHLSPLARLSGGYGFVSTPDGHPIRSTADIRPADTFRVHLRDGLIEATADKVSEVSGGRFL